MFVQQWGVSCPEYVIFCEDIMHALPCCNYVCAQIVVSCTKGISVDSLETVNQILTRVLPEALHTRLAYLSGPSFAAEAGPHTFLDDRILQVQPAVQVVAQLTCSCQINGNSVL